MTRAAASAHPPAPAAIPPPPPDRHPKHPAYLFATHLSQSAEAAAEAAATAQHASHPDPGHTAQQDPAPDAAVSDNVVPHGQPDYVHSASHTHSDPALPEVAHTEPTFDIQIPDHSHQDPPHLSDQPVPELAPVTDEELQGAADDTQDASNHQDEPALGEHDLGHNPQHHDAQPLPVDHASQSHHPASGADPGAPGDAMHVDPSTPSQAHRQSAPPLHHSTAIDPEAMHQASHIVQHGDTPPAADSGRDASRPTRMDSQSVHSAVQQALQTAVQQVQRGNSTSVPGPSHHQFNPTTGRSAAEALAEQMVSEGTPETPRVTSHNGGILQHLAARAESPKAKRARLMQAKSPAILARGASISLARRAAATAKKRRDEARAELERNGICEGVERALEGIVGISASTRANVSQNREKRVQRVKWRPEEVEALRKGVEKYGVGRWAVILREFASAFDPVRISVDLKDKWRNIFKVPKTRVPRTNVNVEPTGQTVLAGYVAGGIQQQAQTQQMHPKRELSVEQRGQQVSDISGESSQVYAAQQGNPQHQHESQAPQHQHQSQGEDHHSDAAITELSQYEENVEHPQREQGRKRPREQMLEAINPSAIGNSKNISSADQHPMDADSSQQLQHAQVEDGVEQLTEVQEHVEQHVEEHTEQQVERQVEMEQNGEHLDQLSVLPSEQPAEPLAESLAEPLTEQHVNDQLEAEVNEHADEAQQHVEELEEAREEEVKVAQGKLLDGTQEEMHGEPGQTEVHVVESAVAEGDHENIHNFRDLE